jgi:hypothetical protein
MFSSDMGKIIELQGQYIDRVNRNAANLNKQLQFLVNIGEQIGGAGKSNLIIELQAQDVRIAEAMKNQEEQTKILKESIKSIINSYAALKTTSGDSGKVVEELMTYLNTLKTNNMTKLINLETFNKGLNDTSIQDALNPPVVEVVRDKSYVETVKSPVKSPVTPPVKSKKTANQ